MKKYQILLFDVDGTLLNFDAAEKEGIEGLLRNYGVPVTEEHVERYHVINKRYWEMLERGERTREQILSERFEEYFAGFDVLVNGVEADRMYRGYVNYNATLVNGAIKLLESLKGRYLLYIVTNGVAETQYQRLKMSGLDQYFDGIFISEEAGAQKPQAEFFEYCFKKMGRYDTENMLIIGDSLTSDMRGGNNAGIDTMWYNPHGQENKTDVHVTYMARTLEKIAEML